MTTAAAPARMTAVCSRKDLYEAVQTVGHAVSGRTSLPILSHVLVETAEEGLRLTATDLEMGMSLLLRGVDVETEGGFTAPARILTELLGAFPDGDVTLSVGPTHAVRLHCGSSDYKILGLPAEEYPRLPDVSEEHSFTLPQALVRDMARKTLFATCADEARVLLTGVLIDLREDSLRFVATDSHRLALCSIPVTESRGPKQAIVPARAMNELMRLLDDAEGDVHVRFSETQIRFETPRGITVISRLIDGRFPNYERMIPAPETARTKLILERPVFQSAVRRAAIVARNNANRVILKSADDRLTVRTESPLDGTAYEEVEAAREGDDVEVAFNAKYLLDVAGAIGSEGLVLQLTEPLKPAVARPAPADGDETHPIDYLCVLMPMQI